MKKNFFVVIVLTIYVSSCMTKENPMIEINACATISFKNDVQPVINQHCAIAGCHVAGFLPGDFTSYAGLIPAIDSGLFQLMVMELKIMPPGDSLNAEEFYTLECWLENGAPDN